MSFYLFKLMSFIKLVSERLGNESKDVHYLTKKKKKNLSKQFLKK